MSGEESETRTKHLRKWAGTAAIFGLAYAPAPIHDMLFGPLTDPWTLHAQVAMALYVGWLMTLTFAWTLLAFPPSGVNADAC